MRKIALFLLFVVAQGCTAGGVAVGGNGWLTPVADAAVTYTFKQSNGTCKSLNRTTNSSGQFYFYGQNSDGSINQDAMVPPGEVCVTVKAGSIARTYHFEHAFDRTCSGANGSPIPCSKDLLLWNGVYDELAANAPGPDVHVRYSEEYGGPSGCALFFALCNVK